jgi:hypothetical protein
MKRTDWKYAVDVLMFLSMLGIIVIGFLMAFAMESGPMVKESEKYFLGLHRHQWGTLHLYLSLFFTGILLFHLILEWSWIKGKTQKLFKARWKQALGGMIFVSLFILVLFWILTPKYPVEYSEYGRGQGRAERPLPRETTTPSDQRFQNESKFGSTPEAKSSSTSSAPGTLSTSLGPRNSSERDETEKSHAEPKQVSGWQEASSAQIVITGRMTMREVERSTGISAEKILAGMGIPQDVSQDEALGRLRRRYGFTLPQMREVIAELMEKR